MTARVQLFFFAFSSFFFFLFPTILFKQNDNVKIRLKIGTVARSVTESRQIIDHDYSTVPFSMVEKPKTKQKKRITFEKTPSFLTNSRQSW